nr:hypothetical protein [Tanacetum cinerariifolium]
MLTWALYTGVPNAKASMDIMNIRLKKMISNDFAYKILRTCYFYLFNKDWPISQFTNGVESYQKKLNLTKPDTYRSNLRNKTAYTSYSDPHGIIYVDKNRIKRLMRTDELHKFSDDTLNDVWYALHNIAVGIRMEYLPMRKWSNLDKKRGRVMVQDIDRKLYQRRLMRNLEKFVGERAYRNDLRLLERTI